MTPLWTETQAAAATRGEIGGSWHVFGISIDTRTLKEGDLFVAIKGENFDGHDFIPVAFKKGAGAIMAEELPKGADPAKFLIVSDCMKGLEDLAKAARERTEAKIVGITGSAGKTTIKEMLAHCLEPAHKVHKTEGNLNNHIGLPLTLARMPTETEVAIIELGMNHAGEISFLTKITKPDVAIISSIGTAHAAFFKNQEEIADAKAEIFEGLAENGCAFLPRDSRHYARLLGKLVKSCPLATQYAFGEAAEADIRLIRLEPKNDKQHMSFRAFKKNGTCTTTRIGKHGAVNALAVMGTLSCVAKDAEEAIALLSTFRLPVGRGRQHPLTVDGKKITVINDSYNANPESMRAAIDLLCDMPPQNNGRHIAVLGDMGELGDSGPALHKSLGKYIADSPVDLIFATGDLMAHLYEALPLSKQGAFTQKVEQLPAAIKESIKEGDVIMVKGSNASRMNTVIMTLKGDADLS